ncbi:MAG: hypothetical protein KTR33_11350, partial [Gammaproteobacteria bacterium]|nr:hypothetical protein [Gammaproteobacteria bacterium]
MPVSPFKQFTAEPASTANWLDNLKVHFFRLAAGSRLPATWFENRVPGIAERQAKTGKLHIEIVSHCWRYSHMMLYQLSSLVLYPPAECTVTMTVCYSEEDTDTKELLDFFAEQTVSSVRWNWLPLHRY